MTETQRSGLALILEDAARESASPDCLVALANDVTRFETLGVPEGLRELVKGPEEVLYDWYRNMAKAYESDDYGPPKTPAEATALVYRILEGNTPVITIENLEAIVDFYGLPHYDYVYIPPGPIQFPPETRIPILHTLPVTRNDVTDWGGLIVFVEVKDMSVVPSDITFAMKLRREALDKGDHGRAQQLLDEINAGDYAVKDNNGVEILARKYQVRLRGIDLPEVEMPYGTEARDAIRSAVDGECLVITANYIDKDKRLVADVDCIGKFTLQKRLLKEGWAWLLKREYGFDIRRLVEVEKDARARKVGLWAASNPEEPWAWRKRQRAVGVEREAASRGHGERSRDGSSIELGAAGIRKSGCGLHRMLKCLNVSVWSNIKLHTRLLYEDGYSMKFGPLNGSGSIANWDMEICSY